MIPELLFENLPTSQPKKTGWPALSIYPGANFRLSGISLRIPCEQTLTTVVFRISTPALTSTSQAVVRGARPHAVKALT
jgi:hypothetical protein